MIRLIYLVVVAIRSSVAFSPPRPSFSQMRNPNAVVQIFQVSCNMLKLNNKCVPVTESYLVSRRMRLRGVSSEEENNNNNLEESELILTSGVGGLGDFKPEEKLGLERDPAMVGDPQTAQLDQPMNITKVLTELQAMQSQGPQKYCILGTRHCSFLHQQIVEMLAYALVLSGNHLYTSGAAGTNAAAIRGALRAFKPQLLTVVLPQSMSKQTSESQELLQDVTNVVTMPQNDDMPLDVASRICNSHLLSMTDHLISFAFHESRTVLEAAQEAQKLDMLVTLLFLD